MFVKLLSMTRTIGMLALGLLLANTSVTAQDTEFSGGTEEGAACPPYFYGVYYAADFNGYTFWGQSRLGMAQGSEYAYNFRGKTNNGLWEVTGTHYVASSQCGDAAWSYYFKLPAQIVRLWNRNITKVQEASNTTCGDPTALDYDPYSDGSGDECTETSYSGGDVSGGSGSGTYFNPGDNTNGETVNWHTGQGNGGSSECGAAAVVEYVCIDVYNESTGQWEEYSCGYATVC